MSAAGMHGRLYPSLPLRGWLDDQVQDWRVSRAVNSCNVDDSKHHSAHTLRGSIDGTVATSESL